MLTKEDLRSIKSLIENSAKPLELGLKEVRTGLSEVRTEVKGLKAEVKSNTKEIKKLKKDQKVIISLFDKEHLQLRKRVDRIDNHLNLTHIN